MCFQFFLLINIFFQYEELSGSMGKTEKISQYCVGLVQPSCFGTGHVTVLSTPHWKTE